MKFETKAFVVLLLTLIFGISVINALSVMYLKLVVEESLKKELDSMYKLYAIGIKESIPEYIKIKSEPEPPQGFQIAKYTGKHFIFIKKDYIQEKLKPFAISILLWESILIITLILLFHRVVMRYMKREVEMKDIANLLLLDITHRIGNFLSAQRINIELINNSRAIDRLKRSLLRLETHYKKTLQMMEMLEQGHGLEALSISLHSMIEEVMRSLPQREDVRLKLKLQEVSIKANPVYMEILLSSLIDNAFKYAKSRVYIKLCRGRNRPVLIVRNDVKTHSGGSGMGLQIVRFVSRKVGVEVRYRIKNHFTAVVKF